MADLTASSTPSAKPGSLFATTSHVRKRRRAEWRLKAYGVLAIAVAALALVSLLGSVLTKATGALTETYIVLETPLDGEALALTPDAEADQIRKADFADVAEEALGARFPEASGRSQRKALRALISGGAPYELADHVAQNPDLIGQTANYAYLGSDVTDLYFKGGYGALEARAVTGQLTVEEAGRKTYQITSTAPDFAAALRLARAKLREEAEALRYKAARQDNAVQVYGEEAAATTDTDARDKLVAKAEKAADKRDKLLAEAAALDAQAYSPGGSEALEDETQSVLINVAGGWLRLTEVSETGGIAEALAPLAGGVDGVVDWKLYITELPESARQISDHQIAWLETLKASGEIKTVFNWRFFSSADSRAPELAGIWGAAVGSFWTMMVTFALAFPIGVFGAIYLEEFAPKNRLTAFIEVNINNLAAVPSIVFGLLGLAVFLNVFGVPRSAPLAGGIVLALMTLPTIIIAARAAIRAVPPSIRDAALGVGASPVQASFHHVLPLAMPGILTGTIIGMAQALGETAPLIMIGMVAFIVDVPSGITDSATVLPVQVFRWSDFPEQAFEARTAAAICVLLIFLVLMNLVAIILRRRFERRW